MSGAKPGCKTYRRCLRSKTKLVTVRSQRGLPTTKSPSRTFFVCKIMPVRNMAEISRQQSWISSKWQNLEPCRSWLGLAAAVFSFLVVAFGESFGVYYEALVEKYDSTRQAVGWIYSFRWIFIFISGKYELAFVSPVSWVSVLVIMIIFGFVSKYSIIFVVCFCLF